MSETGSPWMEFTRYVPGFDFLRNLVPPGLAGVPPNPGTPAAPGTAPNILQQWLAPTMDEEQVQKRIDELKSVQFWLEQNSRALQATIQALEVQKMTLSALKTMGQGAQDMAQGVAQAFDSLRPVDAQTQAEQQAEMHAEQWADKQPASRAQIHRDTHDGASPTNASTSTASPLEPESQAGSQTLQNSMAQMQHIQGHALQWWGALTEQFQTIATRAMQDIGQQVSQHMQQAQPQPPEQSPAQTPAPQKKPSQRTTKARKTKAKNTSDSAAKTASSAAPKTSLKAGLKATPATRKTRPTLAKAGKEVEKQPARKR